MHILARAVGRRKEAVAQVQLLQGTGLFMINEKPAEVYLQNNTFSLLKIKSPFEAITADVEKTTSQGNGQSLPTHAQLDTIVKVKGGGLIGQAEAIKLAVARALCQLDQSQVTTTEKTDTSSTETTSKEVRKILKLKGYLTQDSRVKERRKYGLKKARKAPQFSKR